MVRQISLFTHLHPHSISLPLFISLYPSLTLSLSLSIFHYPWVSSRQVGRISLSPSSTSSMHNFVICLRPQHSELNCRKLLNFPSSPHPTPLHFNRADYHFLILLLLILLFHCHVLCYTFCVLKPTHVAVSSYQLTIKIIKNFSSSSSSPPTPVSPADCHCDFTHTPIPTLWRWCKGVAGRFGVTATGTGFVISSVSQWVNPFILRKSATSKAPHPWPWNGNGIYMYVKFHRMETTFGPN